MIFERIAPRIFLWVYNLEQLPHCNLLRLSLLTGWFVLSARQVIRPRLSLTLLCRDHPGPRHYLWSSKPQRPSASSRHSVLTLTRGTSCSTNPAVWGQCCSRFQVGCHLFVRVQALELSFQFILGVPNMRGLQGARRKRPKKRVEFWSPAPPEGGFSKKWKQNSFWLKKWELFKITGNLPWDQSLWSDHNLNISILFQVSRYEWPRDIEEKWDIAVRDSIEAQVIWIDEMKFFWSNVLVGF